MDKGEICGRGIDVLRRGGEKDAMTISLRHLDVVDMLDHTPETK